MGWFGSLFSRNWQAELDRAEALLGRGEPVRALEIAERVERGSDGALSGHAVDLRQRARAALLETLLARAAQAEGEGDWRDAADWLLAALEHLEGGPQATEVEARRQQLLAHDEERDNPYARVPTGQPSGGDAAASGDDLEVHYETLVSTLGEELAGHYEDRPRAFRQAVVDLNEGRAQDAREALEELLEGTAGDPVLELELGRARLVGDDPEGACEVLARAWASLGDGPLDATDSLSAPLLWAEAALASGHSEEVIERLNEVSPSVDQRPELARIYGEALLAAARLDEAQLHLAQVLRRFPGHQELTLLMARALAANGELPRAIAGLEAVVGPTCAGGRCGQRLHPPSVRELCSLYLDQGEGNPRVGELMAVVARNQRGLLSAADHRILARWYEQTGDLEAAAHCAGESRRLTAAGAGELSAPPPLVGAGQQRIL